MQPERFHSPVKIFLRFSHRQRRQGCPRRMTWSSLTTRSRKATRDFAQARTPLSQDPIAAFSGRQPITPNPCTAHRASYSECRHCLWRTLRSILRLDARGDAQCAYEILRLLFQPPGADRRVSRSNDHQSFENLRHTGNVRWQRRSPSGKEGARWTGLRAGFA